MMYLSSQYKSKKMKKSNCNTLKRHALQDKKKQWVTEEGKVVMARLCGKCGYLEDKDK